MARKDMSRGMFRKAFQSELNRIGSGSVAFASLITEVVANHPVADANQLRALPLSYTSGIQQPAQVTRVWIVERSVRLHRFQTVRGEFSATRPTGPSTPIR